jgi:hypothetical protein
VGGGAAREGARRLSEELAWVDASLHLSAHAAQQPSDSSPACAPSPPTPHAADNPGHTRPDNHAVDSMDRPSRRCYTAEGHKGSGSRAEGNAMAVKLIEAVQHRWRTVNTLRLIAFVELAPCPKTASSSNN